MASNLEAVVRLARVRAPRQRRSRETLARVLDTFGAMLAEMPFDAISMAELARRSGTAVTSIYARFADKRALLLAAHERHRDEMLAAIDALLDPARWRRATLERIVHGVLRQTLRDRRRRVHLLRAALAVNDPDVRERAAEIGRHASARMAALLAPRLGRLRGAERDRAVDFGMRAVTAVLQQRLVFGDVEPARFRLTDTELARRLGDVFLGALRARRA